MDLIKLNIKKGEFVKFTIEDGKAVIHSSSASFPVISEVALLGIVSMLKAIPSDQVGAVIASLSATDSTKILNSFGYKNEKD